MPARASTKAIGAIRPQVRIKAVGTRSMRRISMAFGQPGRVLEGMGAVGVEEAAAGAGHGLIGSRRRSATDD
jgi:hypothetical protein